MRKLYKDAKNAELAGDSPKGVEDKKDQNALEKLYLNPFDDSKLKELDDNQFENEVNNLIEWCEDLDYEKYVNNWHCLATSAYSGNNNNNIDK